MVSSKERQKFERMFEKAARALLNQRAAINRLLAVNLLLRAALLEIAEISTCGSSRDIATKALERVKALEEAQAANLPDEAESTETTVEEGEASDQTK